MQPKNYGARDMVVSVAEREIKSMRLVYSSMASEVTSELKTPNFEDLLDLTGGFGLFQILILVALLGAEIPAAFVAFAPVFVGRQPESWMCTSDDGNSTTGLRVQDLCSCEGSILPVNSESSIVAEWKLFCGSSFVSDFITSVQMLGMLVGSLFSSQLSDWYGRKKMYLAVCVVMAAGQCLSAMAPGPLVYAFARFLCGAGLSGFMGMSTIYPMEFLTPKWRCLCGSVGPWGEGIMILPLLAIYFQEWRHLLWICTVPFLFVVLCYPLVPESPRWLLRNKRINEASLVLRQMHRINNGGSVEDFEITEELLEQVAREETGGGENSRFTYMDFVYSNTLRKKTLYLMGIWFSWALVYFGLSYNIKNMKGSPYMNVFYLGLADAVGYPCAMLVNNSLGRRKAMITFMCLGSMFLVVLAGLDLCYGLELNPAAVTILCLMGKFGVAGARSAARCLTGESFPTPIRTMGYGISGVTAGIGGIIAPQLAFFGSQWWHPLPFVAFGVISVGGSALSLCLPETADKRLEEKMDGPAGAKPRSNQERAA